MKLVLQRGNADCGIAVLATYTEQSYEDVFVAAATVDAKARGRSGVSTDAFVAMAKKLGVSFRVTLAESKYRDIPLEGDETGILAVRWKKPHKHPTNWHFVIIHDGTIVDVADGAFRPFDEYLVRERARVRELLVEA